ncbi:MAG: protein kinase domain-containing protein [Longimicrobiaceae bacterium]
MAGIESLLRGRVLADRYRIEEVIGRGGMGAVYRAADERLGRAVAVKVITATAADPETRERVRARFIREARAAARLPHHPNVVPVYDYGTDEETGLDYIVMELLRGEDLASRLQRAGAPPMEAALRILEQAARGVNVGHRMGVIHRDVKPGNIFLLDDGDADDVQVRVLDFGIAKVMAEEDTETALTHDGRAPLSPAYASPEQLRGEGHLTPASDVFALGAVGYQLLTGAKPYTEADRNRMAIGQAVPTLSVRARNPAVPPEVEAVIGQALAHDAAARFPNGGAFADAVSAVARRLAGTAAAAAVPVLAGPVVATDADDDRTAVAGDDRTMVAPRADVGASGGAGYAPVPPRTGPAIPPPRRRVAVAQARRGPHPVVWVLLVLALLGGGTAVWWAASGGRGPGGRPLSDLPDSAQKDTTGADSLTLADAPRIDRQGLDALNQRDWGMAAELFRQAMELDPQRAEYKDHYAYALINQGQYTQAVALLEQAIRQDANYDLSYSHLADARLALGDSLGAVVALQRFLQVSVNQRDRAIAQQKLNELMAPHPAPPPPDTAAPPPDTVQIPTNPDEPRDTIRIAPPR